MVALRRLRDLWRRAGVSSSVWRDQRGNILLFTTVAVVPIMIVMGGLAMDIAHLTTVDGELQKSMDAAALAGAGKLGFDDSVFPTVRQTARDYASRNGYRAGTVSLDLNTGNTVNGNIVLGIWNGTARTFTPSLDGSQVNAVKCQYNTTIPTSFLGLLGLRSLGTAAGAIAIANPPAQPSCNEPILPIAVKACAFKDPVTGQYNNSTGCGSTLSWIIEQQVRRPPQVQLGRVGEPGRIQLVPARDPGRHRECGECESDLQRDDHRRAEHLRGQRYDAADVQKASGHRAREYASARDPGHAGRRNGRLPSRLVGLGDGRHGNAVRFAGWADQRIATGHDLQQVRRHPDLRSERQVPRSAKQRPSGNGHLQ